MNEFKQHERYQRQMLLKELGESGQQKLLQSKVLVIGAGGLGCPVLQYLTAAGVGTIGIVDDDVVSLTNLHRQVLYATSDVGFAKAERAATVLKELNPEINILALNTRLTHQNALNIISAYDIVVDGTDNFGTRYLINDACVLLHKPLVYGAVSKFEGQVAVFNVDREDERGVNYRDLFPNPPSDNEIPNCAEAGVLGVLPGIIGSMQANETIKLITGVGVALINKLLTYNALNNTLYEVELFASEESVLLIPKDEMAFKAHDYNIACATGVLEIDAKQFNELIGKENIIIVDVREDGEQPIITEFDHLHLPLSILKTEVSIVPQDTIITFCQSGKRSLQAARLLYQVFDNDKRIYSLKDGISSWKQFTSKR